MGTTEVASHPFASLRVHTGDATLSYGIATAPGAQQADAIDRANTLPPAIAERNGHLVLEHGLHQELSYSTSAGKLHVRMTAFRDRLDHPLVSGGGVISAADWKSANLLYDSATGALQVAATGLDSDGAIAEMKELLPDDMWISLKLGTGDSLVMNSSSAPMSLDSALSSLRAHRTEMVALTYGGKLEHAGTQWQASYQWQQHGAVTAVDPFDPNLRNPYLSFYLRQPIRCRGILPNGMEALIDVRNLLAQGYRPFVTSDGSVLYFAQASRAVEGGLSFSF